MSYTMFVPIIRDEVNADVWAIARCQLPSGADIGYNTFIADFADDVQARAVYDFAIGVLARQMLIEADVQSASVTKSYVSEGGRTGADIEFRSEADAMLFKLTHGGAQ